MRLTLVLVLATLGIVAKANPNPLTVKAHVDIKSGSTVLSKDPSGSVRRSSRGVDCEGPKDWEKKGILYSYCPEEGSSGHTQAVLKSGNWVKAAFDQSEKTIKVDFVSTDDCEPREAKDCN